MSESTKSGGELFIVDNSDESWKGIKYLQDWTEIASAFDIATGYYEIGGSPRFGRAPPPLRPHQIREPPPAAKTPPSTHQNQP